MFSFVNGRIVEYKDAKLHVSDLAIQRGYGVFDFLKISNAHAYFLNDYLDRFFNSASVMRLDIPLTRPELVSVVGELVQKNSLMSSGIKMVLTGGYSDDGYQPGNPNLIITQQPLTLPSEKQLESGVSIITHQYVRDIPTVKTINYTMGIWLNSKLKERNAYDVLYFQNGIVSEFPRSNFFIVNQNDVVVTPATNVLAGVTRKNVLALAGKHYKSEARDLTIHDIYTAKEAFITSTTKRILPVVEIDGRKIGQGKPGSVSLALYQRLVDLELEDVRQKSAAFTS